MREAVMIGLLVFFPPPPEALWQWPTEGPPLVLRDFEAPQTPWGAGHRGIDLAASSSVIRAPVGGRVSFQGFVADRDVLTITTARGWQVSMEPVWSELSEGEWVRAGEIVGELSPGHCPRACLHLGLRIEGQYRSPRQELGIMQRATLLPWNL